MLMNIRFVLVRCMQNFLLWTGIMNAKYDDGLMYYGGNTKYMFESIFICKLMCNTFEQITTLISQFSGVLGDTVQYMT